MQTRPFALAAIDQKLLLTFATLHLAIDARIEVPRIGQVLVRHSVDRRPLVLTPLHWGVLKQFEGGRTVASVLKQLIHGRSCVPLADFYELIVKAHRHGLLSEIAAPVAAVTPACAWRFSVQSSVIRRVAIACMAAVVIAMVINPPAAPAHWLWWLPGWFFVLLADAGGFALAASVLHGADFDVRAPRWILKSARPRFEIDLTDAEIAPPDVAIDVALARLAPPLGFAALAAFFVPSLALPMVGGLLYALAPLGSGPLLALLRALHHEPRLSVAHDFQFEANRTLVRRLRSWLAPEELRFAFLRVGYSVVWTLLVALALGIATETDARAWFHDFTALDVPGLIAFASLGLLVLGLGVLAGFGLMPLARRLRRRARAWLDQRRGAFSEPPRAAPGVVEIHEFLGKTHPFELIPERDRQALASALELRTYAAGETLVPAGDKHRRLRILFSGRVGVQTGAFHAVRNELHPGGLVAEQALLHDLREPHEVRAIQRSLVLELEYEEFTRLVVPFVRPHVLEDSATKVSLLRQLPLSRDWPQALMASFARRAVIQSFDARTQVIEAGRDNTLFFLVIEGELRALKNGRVVGSLRRGDIFGEISLLQNSITQADIIGHVAGRFLCISKPDFLAFLTQDTSIALQIEAIATRRLGHEVFSPPSNPLSHFRRG